MANSDAASLSFSLSSIKLVEAFSSVSESESSKFLPLHGNEKCPIFVRRRVTKFISDVMGSLESSVRVFSNLIFKGVSFKVP